MRPDEFTPAVAIAEERAAARWSVRLDDGTTDPCRSLQSAADAVRASLATGHACEIHHLEDGEWKLYERFEPKENER